MKKETKYKLKILRIKKRDLIADIEDVVRVSYKYCFCQYS